MTIPDLFVFIFSSALQAIFNLLPEYSSAPLPQTLLDSFEWLAESVSSWNNVFPVTTLITAILFILTFEAAFYTIKLAIFIYDKIRGSG